MKVEYTIYDKEKVIEMKPNKEGWTVKFVDDGLIKPMFDYIVVEKDEEKKTTNGGLVIPDSSKEKPSTGTIIAVGDGAINSENGSLSPMLVKVGDRIIFPQMAGKTIKINNVEKTLLKQTEILGIIE